jgi:hypothetical protein
MMSSIKNEISNNASLAKYKKTSINIWYKKLGIILNFKLVLNFYNKLLLFKITNLNIVFFGIPSVVVR